MSRERSPLCTIFTLKEAHLPATSSNAVLPRRNLRDKPPNDVSQYSGFPLNYVSIAMQNDLKAVTPDFPNSQQRAASLTELFPDTREW
ncbi:MAG: hypothetical protein CBE43_05290 [Rhodopirellula sp. TMED283]|nr:MAG: hypothetical protein CBE43_05290 [Rhodopirellula sp. TMED283]